MSKVISIQGNHDFTGYEVTTDMPVDNIRGTEYDVTQRQFIENQQNPTFVYGAPNMSGNGLYCMQTSLNHVAELWHRSSIYRDFTYLRSFPATGTRPFGKLSLDGSVVALGGNGGLKIYERDPITDIYTLTYTGGSVVWDMDLSSDGNTVIVQGSSPSVAVYKRDNPASWTQLATLTPTAVGNIIWGATYAYTDISDTGEFISSFSRKGVSFWTRNIDGITYTETPDVTYVGGSNVPCFSTSLNSDATLLLISNNTVTELWKRLPSWTRIHLFDVYNIRSEMSKDGTTVRIGDFIYKANDSTFTKWNLMYTLPAPITITNDKPAFNFDYYGYTFMTSGTADAGSTVYSIENEVRFEQSINTKILNFNDTLKITSAFGSADHLVTFPSFNQAGSLINDGVGNCLWGEPFDQCLNKDCAVQFDCIGLSPNLGQTTTGAELQLSMRLLNDSYTGSCVKVRRSTDFTIAYTLDTELDDSGELTGAATYNNVGGTSTRGRFTATLAVSDTFTIDGTSLSSVDNGTRILFVGQNNQDENGIWTTTISGTSLTLDRSTDFDADGEVNEGDSFYITTGTTYADTGYKITTIDSIVVGGASGSDLTFSTIDVLKDIGFSNGTIDIAGLSNLLEDDTGYVNTWYDQSVTNNFDFTQTVEDSQPQILLSGGINWLPIISFDGVDDYLDAGDVLDIGTNVGWFVNLVSETNATGGAIISKSSDNDNNRWGIAFNTSNFEIIYEDSVDVSTSTAHSSGDPQIISLLIDRNSGTQTLNSYIDNSNIDIDVAITEIDSYNFNSTSGTLLGAIDDQGLKYMTGKISEVVIHNFVLTTTERVGIEQEQANYYGITISEMPKINFKIDTSITADYSLTFPASQGANNETLINDGSGNLSWGKITYLNSFVVSGLPSAAIAGGIIYVSDETGGATMAFSDGTNWRRVQDRTIVA